MELDVGNWGMEEEEGGGVKARNLQQETGKGILAFKLFRIISVDTKTFHRDMM